MTTQAHDQLLRPDFHRQDTRRMGCEQSRRDAETQGEVNTNLVICLLPQLLASRTREPVLLWALSQSCWSPSTLRLGTLAPLRFSSRSFPKTINTLRIGGFTWPRVVDRGS